MEVSTADGEILGDRLVLAPVRLLPAAVMPVASPPISAGVWQNGIALAAASVITNPAGLPTAVTLTWAPTATIQTDYTVFVQVLDANSNILAQADSPPQGGEYPTSTWRTGDRIADTIQWEGNTNGWERVIIGLYGADGKRLPLVDGGDFLEIALTQR
jgi:hypothetical protein